MAVPEPIVWADGALRLLDQRHLPGRVRYLDIESVDDAVTAIRSLAVRGAPAIGIAAAYALAVAVRRERAADLHGEPFVAHVDRLAGRLIAARPTAVNLA